MEANAKCNYCDFFGNKPHCHNCKIFNNSRTYVPSEISLTLEEIIDHINNNETVEAFNIGDYKYITLYTGEIVKLIVLDFNKDTLASDGTSTAKVTFGILKTDGLFKMNDENTNEGGWASSMMRARMERFFTILPAILKENIKPIIKNTADGGMNATLIPSTDKLFLFSESELYGRNVFSKIGEGEQYEYFLKEENRVLATNNRFWLRSPCIGSAHNFCNTFNSINPGGNSANNYGMVTFGFCI